MKAEILILGVLHRGDMHPYEIKRRLKVAQVESYIDVDVGTLYYAVKQLHKDGLIEERGQESAGKQVRTIYGLTDAGRQRFLDLVHEGLAIYGTMNPIYPSLIFLHWADREVARAIMAERIKRLTASLETTEAIHRHTRTVTSGGIRLMTENAIVHLEAEIGWSKQVLAELEAGEIFSGDLEAAHKPEFKDALDQIVQQSECKEK